jgi:hypothetical protein
MAISTMSERMATFGFCHDDGKQSVDDTTRRQTMCDWLLRRRCCQAVEPRRLRAGFLSLNALDQGVALAVPAGRINVEGAGAAGGDTSPRRWHTLTALVPNPPHHPRAHRARSRAGSEPSASSASSPRSLVVLAVSSPRRSLRWPRTLAASIAHLAPGPRCPLRRPRACQVAMSQTLVTPRPRRPHMLPASSRLSSRERSKPRLKMAEAL